MSRWSAWSAGSPRTIAERDRPRPAATAAPLRRLAPAAPAAPPHRRRSPPPTTRPSSSSSTSRPRSTLLDWLTAHGLTLATARQGDLEAWLASDDAVHRREAGNFVRWAKQQKLTSLDFAATKWGGPTQRHRHRDALGTGPLAAPRRRPSNPRTASPACSSCSTPNGPRRSAASPSTTSTSASTRYGCGSAANPSCCPSPSPTSSARSPRPAAATPPSATVGTSRWLFPGGQPGRPISSYQLGERLRQLGLRPGQSRSTALFQLATDLPAALLARMLGIHINVAVAWQRASAGDWTSYAAEISRRTKP